VTSSDNKWREHQRPDGEDCCNPANNYQHDWQEWGVAITTDTVSIDWCPLCGAISQRSFVYGLGIERRSVSVSAAEYWASKANILEGKAALADEAMHYCEYARPFSNEDNAFWDGWQTRYDALKDSNVRT